MVTSLQDQLLQLGLVKTQQVKQVKTAQRKQKRAGGDPSAQVRQQAVQTALAEKQAQDRELNRQRDADAERRAAAHALRELIHANRLPRDPAEVAYHFADGKTLKRLYVTSAQHHAIVTGRLAIVRQDHFYELIPADIAQRVAERDASFILVWNHADQSNADHAKAAEDEYAAYQVPDDLMW
ncbi:DUF2058 domain-containing protein [Rhodoferax sp. 4810]|uniref:DUF2058 domain-containing protein n=1 Tax=Thiospirillum jenense TaxID=1653858 RepID=A0A839HCL3_9GAMM|nr:DUF2058 domain-containing protein [Thiospirillum jenense]MBB1072989.1 DUF2058 domain-containing protein [Rhodoferax jenense]MBB1124937.1 DUF2058 domain-containing protein [Thiospirillum jenense]